MFFATVAGVFCDGAPIMAFFAPVVGVFFATVAGERKEEEEDEQEEEEEESRRPVRTRGTSVRDGRRRR